MSSVGLLFVGAVLLLNGLLFLGKVDGKSVAVFNLFVGALQTAIPFYLIATAPTLDTVLSSAGIFLFGFTYLYVGIINLAGLSSDGLGWYSGWVAGLAICFGLTSIIKFHDANDGLLWLQWAVLWGMFWVVLAAGRTRLTASAGWLTVLLSVTTCTVPGFLSLLGDWSKVPTWVVGASIVVVAIAMAALSRSVASSPEVVETQEPIEPALASATASAGR